DGAIVVKETQIFTVTMPPIGADGDTGFIDDVITGLSAIVGEDVTAPVSDPTTRSIIYTTTQRNAKLAKNYFQRLRANTALVVFETYIWEVALNANNTAGINWQDFTTLGKFNISAGLTGSAVGATNPVSIGLPTTGFLGEATSPTEVFEFLSTFGAVKTISQPQISVLSGSQAQLRVADTENYVSEIVTTISDGGSTTSVNTDSVDTGFTLDIASSWDKSTVYAEMTIALENVTTIEDFTFSDGGAAGTSTTIQLPQTSERELTTQVRVRPGDSLLIGGLVRENDDFRSRGAGLMEPLIPDSRSADAENLELVFMMRPKVVVYTSGQDQRYKNYLEAKQAKENLLESKARADWLKSEQLMPYSTVRETRQSLSDDAKQSIKTQLLDITPSQKPAAPELEPVQIQPMIEESEEVAVTQEADIIDQQEVGSAPEVKEEDIIEVYKEPEAINKVDNMDVPQFENEEVSVEIEQPLMPDENILDSAQDPVVDIQSDIEDEVAPASEPIQLFSDQSEGIQESEEIIVTLPEEGETIEQIETIIVTDEPPTIDPETGRVSRSVNDIVDQYIPSQSEGRVSTDPNGFYETAPSVLEDEKGYSTGFESSFEN
ncbi:MAG: hypothetical protein AAF988_01905, partial [Pseudomonadota bacterium]